MHAHSLIVFVLLISIIGKLSSIKNPVRLKQALETSEYHAHSRDNYTSPSQCMYIMYVRVHACYKYIYNILYVCVLCVCVSVRCVFSAHRVYSLNSSTSDVMAPSWQPPHPSEPGIEGTDNNVQENDENY